MSDPTEATYVFPENSYIEDNNIANVVLKSSTTESSNEFICDIGIPMQKE